MPSLKSDINVTVRVGDKTLSIGAVLLPNGRYAIMLLLPSSIV